MPLTFLSFLIIVLGAYSFLFGRRRVRHLTAQTDVKQHSLDGYHGAFVMACVILPAFSFAVFWSGFAPLVINNWLVEFIANSSGALSTGEINVLVARAKALHAGVINERFVGPETVESAAYFGALLETSSYLRAFGTLVLALSGFYLSQKLIAPRFAARQRVENIAIWVMIGASGVAILTTIGIIFSLIFETYMFFQQVPVLDFLFGLHWSPQIAIREDQAANAGEFGAVPLFAGTLLITFIAMLVAVPVGLMAAVYLSEYASPRLRNFAKPTIEVLAGIPTVVYGFFAALVVAPLLRNSGADIGLTLSSESALAAGLVMGTMLIPFISSLSDDVINAVPQNLRDGASALGATKSETIKQVVLPAALPGIVSAILLAISRAIGETMIVVMAAGIAANLTANPFESVTTVTVQIVVLLIGDQEFDSAKTLAAFALGLVLFFITLILNVVALQIVNKYREQYD